MKKKTKFKIEIVEEKSVDKALDKSIRALLVECFPGDNNAFAKARAWHSAPEYLLVHRKGKEVLGHVAIITREISCGRKKIRIAGIQSLAVGKKGRGTGLSQALMTDSMTEAFRRGIEFGLLFCIPELERFYATLGWKRIEEPVFMQDEKGARAPLPSKNIGMYLLLSGKPFPAGAVDLRGRDW